MLARKVRRMSMMCPRRLAAIRRVRTRSSGSARRAIACLGGGDFGRGHLREILLLQHFAIGDGQPRVDLDLGFVLALVEPPNSASWMRCAPGGGGLGAVVATSGSIEAISFSI